MEIRLIDKSVLLACAGLLCLPLSSYGQQTWIYTYYPNGQIETEDGPRTDVSDITTYTYDAYHNVSTVTNALGHVIQYPNYDPSGRVLQMIDPNGVVTDYSYHVRGWLESTTVRAPASSLLGDAETIYSYDAVGQLTRVDIPDGSAINYDYDGARRLTAIYTDAGDRIDYTLDAAGNRTGEVIKNTSGSVMYSVSRAFDELSRVMDVTGNNNQHDHLDYDVNDNNTALTDGRSNTTQQVFDALDRLTQVTDPALGETHYNYDDQDNLTSVTDPRGLVSRYDYDGFGNLTSVTSPDTGTSTYSYDAAGNQIGATDSRGIQTTFEYDALNRLTAVQYPDNPDENLTYGYDDTINNNLGIGRLTSTSSPTGITHYHYNHHGQIAAHHSTVNGVTTVLEYRYNTGGHLTQMIYPSGRRVHYQRDQLGRISGVTTQADAQAPEQVIATDLGYLPFGPLASYTYGNNLIATRAFDLDYRLTQLEIGSAGPLLQRLYEYDAVNNITYIGNDQNRDRDTAFSYDPLDRLTDALNVEDLFSYSYDPIGNRTEKFHNGHSETYRYGSDSHHLLQRADHVYQYDAAGNTVDNGSYTFIYAANNRLSQVQENGQVLAEYRYNALGQRVLKRIEGAAATDYLALADQQDALAAEYRNEAATLEAQREGLLAQAQSDQQQAELIQEQIADLRRQQDETEQLAAQLEQQADQLAETAQIWRDRAAEMNDQIVESPTRWQRVTNAIYGLLASIYESNVETYQGQADALYAEAEQVRDNPALEAQIAALEQQASDLLLAAQQAQAEAEALQGDIDTLIAQAQSAEAQAEEYRQLAANPPPVARDTVYAYNQTGQVLGEYDEQGTVIREYLYLDGAPLALVSDGEVYYYHNDHLDTPQLLTDGAQQIVWQASYTPFGKADVAVEQVTNNLRFPGQYFDSETGLHYNYFRDYDPSLGRYVQSDPIGLEGGLNLYDYSRQNPLKYIDPEGTNPFQQTMSDFRQALTIDLGRDPVDLVSDVIDPYTLEEKSCIQQCIKKETQKCVTPSRREVGKKDTRLAAICSILVVLTCTPEYCDEDNCSE